MRLRALAPGKVNLSLFLGGLREDRRHELVTLIESVSLADELTLSTLRGGADEVVCPGVEEPNLVAAALAALRARGWDAPPVRIEIVKRIPVAAGMGGGSADAAAALRLASELAPGRPEEIAGLAAQLGTDVTSQLAPGLVLASGAGDVVEPMAPLAPHALLILPQQFALSTTEVYRQADLLGLPRTRSTIAARYEELVAAVRPGARLSEGLIVNDLQPAALSLSAVIAEALEAAWGAGADEAIVCGSGPTVAGIYWGGQAARSAGQAASRLSTRFPGAICAVPVSAELGMPVFA